MKTGRYNKNKSGHGRDENRRGGKSAPVVKRRSELEGKDKFEEEDKSDKPHFEKKSFRKGDADKNAPTGNVRSNKYGSKTGVGREENRRGGKPAPTIKRRSQQEGKDEFKEVRASEKPRFEKKSSKKGDADKSMQTGSMRLNRYVSNAGVCSRRDADELIKKGEITVNGKIVTEMGTQVSMQDDVRYQNERLNAEKKVYILLNKPKDVVTTLDDPHAKMTVMDILKEACPQRIYPVGRLDKATTGLILFTNDGDLAKKLTHPKHKAKKIYHVFLDKPIIARHLDQLAQGVSLEDGDIHADAISYVEKDDKTQVGVEIHSGRNRIVRRMFEHLGYKVIKLDRVFFAGLTKQGIPRGKYRELTPKEITRLKSGFWS